MPSVKDIASALFPFPLFHEMVHYASRNCKSPVKDDGVVLTTAEDRPCMIIITVLEESTLGTYKQGFLQRNTTTKKIMSNVR